MKIKNSPHPILSILTPISVAKYSLSPFPREFTQFQSTYEKSIESYSKTHISNFQNRILFLSRAAEFLHSALILSDHYPQHWTGTWTIRAHNIKKFLEQKIDILTSLFRIFGTNCDFLIDQVSLIKEFLEGPERFDFTFVFRSAPTIALRRIPLAIARRANVLLEMFDPLHRSYHNSDFTDLFEMFQISVNEVKDARLKPSETFLNFMLYNEIQPQADDPFLPQNIYTLSEVKQALLERIDPRYKAGIDLPHVGTNILVSQNAFQRLRALGNPGNPAYLCRIAHRPARGAVLLAPIAAQNHGWEHFKGAYPLDRSADEPRIRGPKGQLLSRSGIDETLLDTRDFQVRDNLNSRIYVIDTTGMLYAGPYAVQRLHHTTLVSGRCILGGGEIGVVEGKIVFISNETGHFQTTIYNLLVCVLFLRLLNVILPECRVRVYIYDQWILSIPSVSAVAAAPGKVTIIEFENLEQFEFFCNQLPEHP